MSNANDQKDVKQLQDESVQKIRDGLDELLDIDKIELAVVVFVHKDATEPQVWRKGHWYDSSALLNTVLSAYRTKAAMELGL
jgi:hypothetical protein